MMKFLLSILMVFVLNGCKDVHKGRVGVSEGGDDSISTLPKTGSLFYIKDTAHYDKSFIKTVKSYTEPVSLIDNYIVTGRDTVHFPEDLPVNREVTLQGIKEDRTYSIGVVRTNFTNLKYTFQVTNWDGKVLFDKKGTAVLHPMFFLAAEMDEDIEMEDTYGSYEYWDKSGKCTFSLRIGIGKDQKGRLRATLTHNCSSHEEHKIKLEDCPILRTQPI